MAAGWPFFAALLGNMAKCRNQQFPHCDYYDSTPLDYRKDVSRNIEIGKRRLADDRKADKRPANKKLISQWVDHSAEFAGNVIHPGDLAIDDICQAGHDKQDKSGQQKTGRLGFLHPAGKNDHCQKNHC